MSNLSTFAEVGLVDARASSGTLILPNSCDIPGRVITFKDVYGATGNSSIALLTSTNDTFEDGTNYKILQNPYDFITLYAASTNIWSIIGGTQVNAFRANIMSNTSNITSSIITNSINSVTVFTSFLFPQTGLSNTITSNLVPTVNATTTGTLIGLINSNYYQIYSQSTILSNIGASFNATSTIFVNASLTPAHSTTRISTISLGTSTNRWNQVFSISTITSTIIVDNAIVNNLIGGSVVNATTTGNLYPFSAGALIGFGSNTAQGGFYAEGHFRSTTTQVIVPSFDNDGFSNVVRIDANLSTPVVNTSTIFARTFVSTSVLNTSTLTTNFISSGNAFISTLNVNGFTIGTGLGFVNIPFLQTVLTSSIQVNTSMLNVSTINQKRYPYASTLNIPASTFTLSGTAANTITNPLILYSNVTFPHAGFFNLTQSAIFSRTSATANVPQASILYTVGFYPSTISNVDGYNSLPYLGNANASTFTTLVETLYISTSQLQRNIIYSDPTGNAYTANLFMSPITFQYIPNNSILPE